MPVFVSNDEQRDDGVLEEMTTQLKPFGTITTSSSHA